MVIKKILHFSVGILLLFCFMRIESFGATFVDRCDSVENSMDVVYEDFQYYPNVEEVYSIESGIRGDCIYAKSAQDKPCAIYGVYGAQQVKITVVSPNSASIYGNNGKLSLGKQKNNYRYLSSDVYVSDDGMAFTGEYALGFDKGYEFKQPIRRSKVSYMGVNVLVINENGDLVMLERKLDNIRILHKQGGGDVYIEDFYWEVPPNSAFVTVTVNCHKKLYDGNTLRDYIQKYPYAITKVEISGERMVLVRNMENEEKKEDNSKNKGKNTTNSKASAGFVVDVQSESYNNTTENVTINDNDTVVQNIYSSGVDKDTKKSQPPAKKQLDGETIKDESIPVSAPEDSVFSMLETNSCEKQPQKDSTWKLAGGVYIAVSLAMLVAALLVKRPKKQ